MKSKEAKAMLKEIDTIFSNVDNFVNSTKMSSFIEVEAYLAEYLAVIISGKYEEIIEKVLIEKAKRTKRLFVENFFSEVLSEIFSNPKPKRIKTILDYCDKHWYIKVKKQSSDIGLSALFSIVNLRNEISHGKNVNITLKEIMRYYRDSKEVIEIIIDVIL
ncbi:MAG: hypothetical protein HYW05_01570 [Candidatus Diapherotrites archaeon]|nr:hypothetical protein [Candidatus Diapherotrites archaeon]